MEIHLHFRTVVCCIVYRAVLAKLNRLSTISFNQWCRGQHVSAVAAILDWLTD